MLQKSNFSMQILLLVLCSPSTLSCLHTFGSLSEIGTKVILCEDVRRGLFPSLLFFFPFWNCPCHFADKFPTPKEQCMTAVGVT